MRSALNRDLKVLIAGGSVAGLTAGLLLRDLGFDVTVHERSPHLLEQRGAGIGLLPESSRYLIERAGMDLDRISTCTGAIRCLNRDGSTRHEVHHRYRFTSWNLLYRSLLHEFSTDRYRLDSAITAVVNDTDRVRVTLTSGAEEDADLLIGADGARSIVRRQLSPASRRNYVGYVAWRTVAPESALSTATVLRLADAITYYMFENGHILLYPIPGPDGSVRPGERLINVVWYRDRPTGDALDDLLTDTTGVRCEISVPPGSVRAEHVTALRESAIADLPALAAEVILASDSPLVQIISEVAVDRLWFGRACLIGDAGILARPHAASGTAKAAADAWALAEALAGADSVQQALSRWEPGQLDLGRQLLARTRRLGDALQVTNDWDPADPESHFQL